MPAQPTNPQPTANERIPRKRQARLDDNGEPAGVPAPKKMKSVEKNGQKKTAPTKARPEKKKTPSIEMPANDSDTRETNATGPPEAVVVESSDDEDIKILEAPKEDAELQLGANSTLFSNRKISY